MVTSCTQSTIEKEKALQEKGMSMQELVSKYINENESMAENKEEENLNYNKEITSRGNEELKKLKMEEYDVKELKYLVVKEEEESTSLEPNEKKEEAVETIP